MIYRFIVGISILSLVWACANDRIKGEFTPEELQWLVYDKNQLITFQDSAGRTIQMKVVFRTELEQVRQYYPIEAEVALSDIDTIKSFRIYLLKDQHSFKRYLRIGEVYRSLDLIQPLKEVQIGGRTYHEVYIIVEDTTLPKKPYIWRALFNKEKGIIEFTTITNQTYRLP